MKKQCSAVVRLVTIGATLGDALKDVPVRETKESGRLLLLGNAGGRIASEENFVFYALQAELAKALVYKRIQADREQSLFAEFLHVPWSTLGLMCMMVGASWCHRQPERAWELLDAFSRYWETFASEGARYSSDAVSGGRELWEVPSFLGPVLAYCGVPAEVLRERLFSEGLPPLLKFVRKRGGQ